MGVAIAPWSTVLTPGQPEVIVPQADLQVKNAALSDELRDKAGRTTIKLTYQSLSHDSEDDEDDEDDEHAPPSGTAVTTVLCSLTPGKIEQSSCDIILEQDMEYILEVVGKNTVHLYGNYIDQVPVDQPPFGSEMDSDEEDDEQAFNLGEVSSDVEVEVDAHEADLDEDDAARFEEVHEEEEQPKAHKRGRDDTMDVDEHEENLSKSQRKKLAKKLKADDGKAVPVLVPEKKVEENVEEKKEEDKKDKKKDKKEKKEKGEKEKPERKEDEKKEKGNAKVERILEGGVKVRDHKVGTGKMAKKGDKVSMRYIGKLPNGTIFDKNTKGKPFVFVLGQGDVIKGWDAGIVGMQIEGEREIIVPPSMGYGNKKMDGIPAGSTLRFEVKLLEIK